MARDRSGHGSTDVGAEMSGWMEVRETDYSFEARLGWTTSQLRQVCEAGLRLMHDVKEAAQ